MDRQYYLLAYHQHMNQVLLFLIIYSLAPSHYVLIDF